MPFYASAPTDGAASMVHALNRSLIKKKTRFMHFKVHLYAKCREIIKVNMEVERTGGGLGQVFNSTNLPSMICT